MLSTGGVDRTGCLEDEEEGREEKKCVVKGLSEQGNRAQRCVGKSPRLGLCPIRFSVKLLPVTRHSITCSNASPIPVIHGDDIISE